MPKIIVTGSNGLIGSEVLSFFANEGGKYMELIKICVLTSLGHERISVGLKIKQDI